MSLIRNEVVLARIESAYNTDSVPVAADAVAVKTELSWAHEGLRIIERDLIKQGLDKPKRIHAGMLKTITIPVELKGSGSAGTAPEFGTLLRACGYGETIVASTSVTYLPVSSAIESCSIYYFEDGGPRHVLTGCRGTVSFNISVDDVPGAIFTITGHTFDPTDTSPPTAVYDATDPVAAVGSTFTFGGLSKVITEIGIETQNEMAFPDHLSASDGYGEIRISGRDFVGSFNPESVLVATDSVIADFVAGIQKAVVIGPIGSASGNIVTFTAPAASYIDLSPAERSGIRVYDQQFELNISSGDDEISLAFT